MANCPYCEYEGEPASVEAHVSGKCDEAHKGKSGVECRDEIEATEPADVADSGQLSVMKADAVSVEAVEEATEGGDGAESGELDEATGGGQRWSASKGLLAATLVLALIVVIPAGSSEPAEAASEGGDGAEPDDQQIQPGVI